LKILRKRPLKFPLVFVVGLAPLPVFIYTNNGLQHEEFSV